MDGFNSAAKLAARFPKKRVFITGAASGLGQALALEFAGAGWRIGILDISGNIGSVCSSMRATGAGPFLGTPARPERKPSFLPPLPNSRRVLADLM